MSKKMVGLTVFIIVLGAAIFVIYSNPTLKDKIYGMTGQKQAKEKKIIVSKEEAATLVKDNMQIFARSVNQKNMTSFYNALSPYWQKRTSVEKLNKSFAPFIKAGVDLTALKNMHPLIDKGMHINEKENLYITGHYNTKPSVVRFKQTYQYQKNKGWQLVEFFVEIK